jgi:hypothetical protein
MLSIHLDGPMRIGGAFLIPPTIRATHAAHIHLLALHDDPDNRPMGSAGRGARFERDFFGSAELIQHGGIKVLGHTVLLCSTQIVVSEAAAVMGAPVAGSLKIREPTHVRSRMVLSLLFSVRDRAERGEGLAC